ncbi:hypothetical protein HDU81_004390 [Chytriomyces hyalinus]|nr:hypothetical protein HDU81_004390 [Chytriomyces hyalinus]
MDTTPKRVSNSMTSPPGSEARATESDEWAPVRRSLRSGLVQRDGSVQSVTSDDSKSSKSKTRRSIAGSAVPATAAVERTPRKSSRLRALADSTSSFSSSSVADSDSLASSDNNSSDISRSKKLRKSTLSDAPGSNASTPAARTPRRTRASLPAFAGSPAVAAMAHRRRSNFVGALMSDDPDIDSEATLDEDYPEKDSDEDEPLQNLNVPPPRSPWNKLVSMVSAVSPIRLFGTTTISEEDNDGDDDDEFFEDSEGFKREAEENDEEDLDSGVEEESEDSNNDEFGIELDFGEEYEESEDSASASISNFTTQPILLVSTAVSFVASCLYHFIISPFTVWSRLTRGFKLVAVALLVAGTTTLVIHNNPAFTPSYFQTPISQFMPSQLVSNWNTWTPQTFDEFVKDDVVTPLREWYNLMIVGNANRIWKARTLLIPSFGRQRNQSEDSAASYTAWITGFRPVNWTGLLLQLRPRTSSVLTSNNGPSGQLGSDTSFQPSSHDWSKLETKLAARVKDLEAAIIKIQKDVNSKTSSLGSLEHALKQIDTAVGGLKESQNALSSSFKTHTATAAEKNSGLDASVDAVSKAVGKLRAEIVVLSHAQRDEKRDVNTRFQSMGEKIQVLTGDLDAVKKQVADSAKSLDARMLAVIQDHVPSMLVVAKTSAGDLILDPVFLGHLKDRFQTKEEQAAADAALRDFVSQKLVASTSGQVSAAQVDSIVHSIVTELRVPNDLENQLQVLSNSIDAVKIHVSETVKREIKDALEHTVSKSDLQESLAVKSAEFHKAAKLLVNEALNGGNGENESKVILTRAQVVALLETELAKTVEGLQKSLDDKLGAVSAQERAKVDMTAMKGVMNSLIKNALAKYAADGIGREDYALETNGAAVINALTSDGYTVASKSWVGRLLGHRKNMGWAPFIAISEGAAPTKCWAMNGTSGTLGIQLASPVIPLSFSVDHADKTLLVNKQIGVRSAPKDIELWAVTGSVKAFKSLDLNDPKTRTLVKPDGTPKQFAAGVLLSEQTFDPNFGSVQTFGVNKDAVRAIEKMGVTPKAVLLRILSNWGNEDYTCLYRIRVHGRA